MSFGDTLYQASATLPFSSIRNAARMMPNYFRLGHTSTAPRRLSFSGVGGTLICDSRDFLGLGRPSSSRTGDEGRRHLVKREVLALARDALVSMAKLRSPVAMKSPHPSECFQVIFGFFGPPFARAPFMRNSSPSVATTMA